MSFTPGQQAGQEWRIFGALADEPAYLSFVYYNQSAIQLEVETVTLLIPDYERTQQDDFVWALPVERVKWMRWWELAKQYKTVTPQKVRYVARMEEKKTKTIIVLPTVEQSDDDAMEACAWLRLIKSETCRMYVLRHTDSPLTGAALINRVMGTSAGQLEEFPDDPQGHSEQEEEES